MANSRKNGTLFILFGALLLFASVAKVSGANYISGLEPDRRRSDIPVITQAKRDADWQKRALEGVSQPYPAHVLQFLKDQGSWYSPFLHPGMPGSYDIRGLHNSKKK